jgi:hypothetical protein
MYCLLALQGDDEMPTEAVSEDHIASRDHALASSVKVEGAAHTPGPWEYVPGNAHHGPYVTSEYGSDICDCYAMSDPTSLSVRNGGKSRPINFMAEMAEPNARLIAAAPELLEAVRALLPEGWGDDDTMDHMPGVRLARLAIAKAQGAA